MKLIPLLSLLVLFAGTAVAHPLSVLNDFVSRSYFIAVVNIVSVPKITGKQDVFSSKPIHNVFVEYSLDVEIEDVLHGTGPKKKKLTARLVRPKIEKLEELPQMREGSKCIVFFDSPAHGWRWGGTVDAFFSLQPYSQSMASRIRVLSEDKSKQKRSK